MADGIRKAGEGVFRVERGGRSTLVYVAGTPDDWWVFCEGRVYRSASADRGRESKRRAIAATSTHVTAPMPATVVKVNVAPGDRVRRGDILVVLDAMKMEMPLRAEADGAVTAVRCRAGALVQADAVLVELE